MPSTGDQDGGPSATINSVGSVATTIARGVAGGGPAPDTTVEKPQTADVLAVLGLIGTTFSVAGAFYQAYLVREKGWGLGDLRRGMIDSVAGITVLGSISLVIMLTVPLAMAGALLGLSLTGQSLNIYSEIGLIMLVGLAAKNGILIVEFANQLQINEGLGRREAVERAAAIRLRPILMTTVSMIVAMLPLLTASGPGAVSRFHIGLTIATGLGIGTLFTLFVVPAMLSFRQSASIRSNA